MSATVQTLLVAVVFAMQLVVLSFFVPRSFGRTYAQLLTRYPPERYPRLYPVAPARLARLNAVLRVVNVLTVAAGALVLLWGLSRHVHPVALSRWMLYACIAQLLPVLLRLPLHMHIARAFRAMPPPAVRSAELRSWHVSDFVPPGLVMGGLVAAGLTILSATAALLRGIPPNSILPVYTLVISGLLLVRMVVVLSGRLPLARPDPYMSAGDLYRNRRFRLRLLFGGTLALCLYFTGMLAYVVLGAPFPVLYIAAGVSLLCQLIFLRAARLARQGLATRDLEPYQGAAA